MSIEAITPKGNKLPLGLRAVALLTICLSACTSTKLKKPMEDEKEMNTHFGQTYTKAELWVDLREAGKPLRRTIPLNQEQTREFLAFFPEFGKGLSSPDAAGWKAAIVIRLTKPDGAMDSIGISEDFSRWSEGQGDWDVSPKFEPFFRSFFHLHEQ